jgi:hypothetical protein
MHPHRTVLSGEAEARAAPRAPRRAGRRLMPTTLSTQREHDPAATTPVCSADGRMFPQLHPLRGSVFGSVGCGA